MEFTTVLFYLFALFLVISGLKVITSRNPVVSALFLVLAFFNAAAIWMLLQAEFLAILLVVVYVGAVMVLFLFVVMMLDIDMDVLRRDFRSFVPMASIVGLIIVVETALILWHGYGDTTTPLRDASTLAAGAVPSGAAAMSNTRLIGKIIYTDYIFAFEIAGMVLLVAIIAAIGLTMRMDGKHAPKSKNSDVGAQLRTRRQDRVRMVKQMSETNAPDASTAPPTPGNSGAGTTGS
jgi:NADH-quinone oxidoreductase subunit J